MSSRPRRRAAIVLGPGRTIKQTPFGTWAAYFRPSHGEQQRRSFATLDAARQWIESLVRDAPLPPLTKTQYIDAQVALSLLPDGATLADLARNAHKYGATPALPLSTAINNFLAEKSSLVSSVMVSAYKRELGRLADAVGADISIGRITRDDIMRYVSCMGASRRNKVLRHISPLFEWAIRTEKIGRNPCALVEKARGIEAPLGVFRPAEAEDLLRGAAKMDPALVPYLALGLFTGIRPAELARLTADNIGAEYIRLDATITKTSRARTVRIRPNLAAWLAAYPPVFPLLTERQRRRLIALHRKIGVPWPQDGMRHSFATYAYEDCKDAAAVAAEMGHTGTAVFFRHYRALAEPGDGARYFGIYPPIS